MRTYTTRHLTDEQLDVLVRNGNSSDDLQRTHLSEQMHLDSCPECLARFLELQRLFGRVQRVQRVIEPPLDLWPAIRATIQAKAEEHSTDRTLSVTRSGHGSTYRWLVAAAVLLLLTSASTASFLYGRRSERMAVEDTLDGASISAAHQASTSGLAAATPDIGGVEGRTASVAADAFDGDAELHTEQELLADLEMRRSSLRPQTSSEIDSSLKVIDQAIAELKAASARDPGNATLRHLLAVSIERKIELLKQTENAS